MTPKADKKKHQPDSWFHRTINWELIRGFGQSRLASVSMAMPFIGYVILYHAEIASYFGDFGGMLEKQEELLIHSTDSVLALSLFAKLNFIYLGLFFIGFGSIAYRLFAPKTVKEFKSISDFSESEFDRTTARRMRTMMETLRSRRPTVADQLEALAPWLDRKNYNLKIAVNELRNLQDSQLKHDVLSSFYNVESRHTSRGWLHLTLILYSLGFSLFVVPGLMFTIRVIKIIIGGAS